MKRWPFIIVLAIGVLLTASGASATSTSIGGPGIGNGNFQVPSGVALDSSGNLYALDGNGASLQKFSNTGTFLLRATSANGINFAQTLDGIAIDGANDVFVADQGNNRLIELTISLAYVATTANVAYDSLAAQGTHLYALGYTGSQYFIDRYTNGVLDESHTFPVGSAPNDLAAMPSNGALHDQIATDASGTVYVSDAANQRVSNSTTPSAFLARNCRE